MKNLPSLIGVIHLPPLAGSPGAAREYPAVSLQKAGLRAVQEAEVLEKAGFEAIILENFGDLPFYRDQVPPETIASLSVIAAAVREFSRIPVGINVLRNDALAALAIASVTGCDFIRVNVLSGVAATDQGIIQGNAAALLRERDRLNSQVAILADVHVKHAKPLSSDDFESAFEDTVIRGMADGVIVTGKGTGKAVDPALLEKSSQLAKALKVPYYVGSGANREELPMLRQWGARVIVSSALRAGGKAGAPLDPKKAKEFAKAFFAKTSVGKTGAKKGR
jgi:membrane complex biogenesis BtpA family protein